jgi:hypothetical protein
VRTSLTAAFKKALLPPESDEVGISLLDIEHVSFGQIYRICDNNQDIVSNGNTYTAYAFDIAFCDEIEGEVPSHNVVLDNTDPSIFQAIRSADARSRIKVTQRFVIASAPNTNQLKRPVVYRIADIEVDENAIVGSLILAVISNEQVPRYKYDDAHFPGL